MVAANSEPTVGELLGSLARDTGVLVRQEVQLATNEMAAKTTRGAHAVAVIAAGGALAHAGALALIAALIVGLSGVIPMWMSSLVVGLVVAGVGYAVMQKGVTALKHVSPVPKQTVQTLKDDAVWAKEQVR